MKLRVKKMNISTGGILIAVMNSSDASKYDIHPLDRLKVKHGKQTETVVVDITCDNSYVECGSIGFFDEVLQNLDVQRDELVTVEVAPKPKSLDYIKRKMDNKHLSSKEISQIIRDIVRNRLSDIELTYFVSACYSNPLSIDETVSLTKAMTNEGDILRAGRPPIMDKHCIGGVPGNRTTLIVVPILAAAGLTVPKTSSRSITSPAGTADTVEVLANVCVDLRTMKSIIKKTNGCMVWGGSLNLAPADDKIIKVEKPMSVDAQSQLLASIISKKMSVSSTHILIDIPCGKGAKVEKMSEARKMAKAFGTMAKHLKVYIETIITDGSNPIGRGIGPALEARDVLWTLLNDRRQSHDLKEKSIVLAGKMLEMAGMKDGQRLARELLDNGLAYKKFIEILSSQGLRISKPEHIKLGSKTYTVKAQEGGVIDRIDNQVISKVARIAGAPANHCCGIYLLKRQGERVRKGEGLFRIYSSGKERMRYAREIVSKTSAYIISR